MLRNTPPGTDFFLDGLSVPTFDSEAVFTALFHSRTDRAGGWNATRYNNAEIDRLTTSLAAETDFTKRNQTIAQIWRILQDEMIYIPLHVETLAYAMKPDVDIPVDIENQPKLFAVKFKRTN